MKSTNHIISLDDLIANPYFQEWVLLPNAESDTYWKNWASEHPDKKIWLESASIIIRALFATDELSPEEVDFETNRLRERINSVDSLKSAGRDSGYKNVFNLFSQWKHFGLGAAASILLVVTAFYLYSNFYKVRGGSDGYKAFVAKKKDGGFAEFINTSNDVKKIILSDSSEVLLEKGGRLNYNLSSRASTREVYLTGNAFFKINRNPSKPFFVFTDNIVTKVLGTSFWVKAVKGDQHSTVIVKTGKVSVFKRADFSDAENSSTELNGQLITPNQLAEYDIKANHLVKSLVKEPSVITENTSVNFAFEDTPAVEVFKKLNQVYGVTIVFDEEVLASCSITADLGDETFYEKLRIICKIINASYQVMEGKVLINAGDVSR